MVESVNVLVTGFGPFRDHMVNASWEAVKLLPNYKLDGVKIHIEEIPVTYKDVESKIPKLWEKLKPKLVLHVGVSSFTHTLSLESKANRTGYKGLDSLQQLHPTGEVCCKCEGDDCLLTQLDLKKICEIVNSKNVVRVTTSEEAGRYLCEFIYYTSLRIDNTRTLFVHVPPLDKPYTAKQLAEGILEIIRCCLEQIS